MTPKQKVMRLAEKLGATINIEKDSISFWVRVEAPRGAHWNDGCVHELVTMQYSGFSTSELWDDVLSRMQCGIESCNNACEWW